MSYGESHIFALYLSNSGESVKDTQLTIADPDLVHRINRVLRLSAGDGFILFNQTKHAQVRITHINSRQIVAKVIQIKDNTIWQPAITFLLPVLKRDALSHAVYGLVEAGISSIQLVTTTKAQRTWGGQKEHERLKRVIIAAAEQAKNFAFPTLKEPIALQEAVSNLNQNEICYFGDPMGMPMAELIATPNSLSPITLLIGPEGDLTGQEKKIIAEVFFKKIRLTPTVLRAESAAFCMASLFRSVFLSG